MSLPIVPLLDWQKAYIADESRFKCVVASVQSGKSFATSLEFSLDAMKRKGLGILLSASDRQSKELMEKVKMHTAAWGVQFEDGYFEKTDIVEHRATFPSGGRIIALPANPDTARGYSGDVFLDEFALHRDSRAIWAAMMSRATRGYKVRVASTFKGVDNKFYELCKDLGLHEGARPERQPVKAKRWSGHWVDIYMAAAQGMPVNVEEQREAIGDEDIWLQDYCNVPMSEADDYISMDLVLACESGDARLEWDGRPLPGLCAGWDFARKRDRSVIFIGYEALGLVVVIGVIYLNRQSFEEQEKKGLAVAAVIQECGGTFCMDAGGNGAQIAEKLQKKFTCVDAVQFGGAVPTGAKDDKGKPINEPVKLRLARDAKRRFEDRTFRLPESVQIRRAVKSVKRSVSPTGNIIIDASRTDQGHADEFWALALLNAAAAGSTGYVPASECGLVGRTVMGGLMGREF